MTGILRRSDDTERVIWKYLILFIVLASGTAGLPARSSAQDLPHVSAAIDSTKILIGRQFHILLQAEVNPDGEKIGWANIPDTFDHLQVVERGKIDTARSGSKEVYRQQITVTGFDSGYWRIPAFDFSVIPAGGNASTLSTEPLFITVNTVPVDTTQPFKPIKNIRFVKIPWTTYLPYALAALAILALVIWLIRRKKPEAAGPPAEAPPSAPPYELALKALRQLEAEKLWQNNEVKMYYTRLTDILRNYFEKQFGVSAMEQTTGELLQNIKTVTQLNQQKENIDYILSMADLAKFAKVLPLPSEHQDCMKKAVDIVEWTKPKPAVVVD